MDAIDIIEIAEEETAKEETAEIGQAQKTSLRKDQRGVTTLEYVVAGACICIAGAMAWAAFSDAVSSAASTMGGNITMIAGNGQGVY